MAQPSLERKGRPRAIRILVVFVLAAIVSLPTAFIVSVLLTPLLWRLEPLLGIELAGHSGPSDMILLTISAAFSIGVTALYVWITRRRTKP